MGEQHEPEKKKQELWLADKLGEDSNVNAAENRGKNTIMKMSTSKIKQVDRPGKHGREKWRYTE
jgi:hypothetical protein